MIGGRLIERSRRPADRPRDGWVLHRARRQGPIPGQPAPLAICVLIPEETWRGGQAGRGRHSLGDALVGEWVWAMWLRYPEAFSRGVTMRST